MFTSTFHEPSRHWESIDDSSIGFCHVFAFVCRRIVLDFTL